MGIFDGKLTDEEKELRRNGLYRDNSPEERRASIKEKVKSGFLSVAPLVACGALMGGYWLWDRQTARIVDVLDKRDYNGDGIDDLLVNSRSEVKGTEFFALIDGADEDITRMDTGKSYEFRSYNLREGVLNAGSFDFLKGIVSGKRPINEENTFESLEEIVPGFVNFYTEQRDRILKGDSKIAFSDRALQRGYFVGDIDCNGSLDVASLAFFPFYKSNYISSWFLNDKIDLSFQMGDGLGASFSDSEGRARYFFLIGEGIPHDLKLKNPNFAWKPGGGEPIDANVEIWYDVFPAEN